MLKKSLTALCFAVLPVAGFAQTTTVLPANGAPILNASGQTRDTGESITDQSLDAAKAQIRAESIEQQRLAQDQQRAATGAPGANGPSQGPASSTPATTPQTAAEQGYGSKEKLKEQQEQMRKYQLENTPRQKGIVVPVPGIGNPVSKSTEYKEWMQNWEFMLRNVGVSEEKIRFEANRLNQSDFELWASRQYRFRQGQEQGQGQYVQESTESLPNE